MCGAPVTAHSNRLLPPAASANYPRTPWRGTQSGKTCTDPTLTRPVYLLGPCLLTEALVLWHRGVDLLPGHISVRLTTALRLSISDPPWQRTFLQVQLHHFLLAKLSHHLCFLPSRRPLWVHSLLCGFWESFLHRCESGCITTQPFSFHDLSMGTGWISNSWPSRPSVTEDACISSLGVSPQGQTHVSVCLRPIPCGHSRHISNTAGSTVDFSPILLSFLTQRLCACHTFPTPVSHPCHPNSLSWPSLTKPASSCIPFSPFRTSDLPSNSVSELFYDWDCKE